MLKADVYAKLVLLLFKGGARDTMPSDLRVCSQGRFWRALRAALREKLAMQLHAAALHSHCWSASLLLTVAEAFQKNAH